MIKLRRGWALLALCALMGGVLAGGAPAQDSSPKDIVDELVEVGSFKTLVVALKAAGLTDTLKGAGPFTLFAPTDNAFKKLEKAKPGTLAMLLKSRNRARLRAILTYHVVAHKITDDDFDDDKLKNGTKVKTVNGQSLTIRHNHGIERHVDHARVLRSEMDCSNGVIHAIDVVIFPTRK